MSTALATLAGKLAERVGMDSVDPQELITTLRQTAFKGDASDAQFIALLIVANQYGLNPWTKEIYAFPDKQNGIVPVVGVDGWSRIINENQQFDGMDFEQDNESCTCRIYRKDRNHPICVGSKRIAELEAWVEYTRAAYVRAKDKGDLIRVITRQPTGFYAYVPCN
ncbi:TPA: phage recombination protein Bet [Escherichia coli]